MRQLKRFYIARGKAKHGLLTHKCPTPAMALDTLHRFQRDAVEDVSIQSPDGTLLSMADLEALVASITTPMPTALEDRP